MPRGWRGAAFQGGSSVVLQPPKDFEVHRRLPETTQRVRTNPASGTDRSHEERQHQQRWWILGRFREPPAAIP